MLKEMILFYRRTDFSINEFELITFAMEVCSTSDAVNIELFRWGQIIKHCDH